MRAYALRWLLTGLLWGTGAHALGLFEAEADIGRLSPPGAAEFDPAAGRYRIRAAGANTWYRMDAFHYLWKESKGDVALSAQVSFPARAYGHEPDPHRKGLLMYRQSLDASSPYVDVAVHGSGLTALQFRREFGANTEDLELNIGLPSAVRLEKRGDQFTLLISEHGEALHAVGASVHLHLKAPFLAGIGALSHDVNTVDTVEFSRVMLESMARDGSARTARESSLIDLQIEDQYRRGLVIRSGSARMQSPHYATGGNDLWVHEGGRLLDIPVTRAGIAGTAHPLEVGSLLDCSGNFGVSPDGNAIAVSCADSATRTHQVHLVPLHGGAVRHLTSAPQSSYFHAWAPDGRTVAFTRGTASRADIYTVSIDGGAERRLTTDTLNDGPDYTPDGLYIYFDSARSGRLQVWRMNADGSDASQVTGDLSANFSPHVSPDGKSIAFLSQASDSGDAIARTTLKILTPADGLIRSISEFEGNRDSLSMNSWADHNHLALVEYNSPPAEFMRTESP